MEYYLSIQGEKHGPVSLFRVGELLREGAVTPETLGWHRGMGAWLPLEEIPSLETLVERESPRRPPLLPTSGDSVANREREESGAPEVFEPALPSAPESRQGVIHESVGPLPELARPARRALARAFDYLLVTVVVSLASSYVPPQLAEGESLSEFFERYFEATRSPEAATYVWTQFFALLAWHGVEAVLVHLVGTTPGKWLFRIQVVSEARRRLPLPRSFGRSYLVYLFGVGLYLGPLTVLALAFSLVRLLATGGVLWDQTLATRAEARPLGARRILFVAVAFLVTMLLPSIKFS